MIFGSKTGSKRTQQMKQTLQDALLLQEQKLSRLQQEQADQIREAIEKNQKTLRNLSDSVEDFLDSQQEQDEEKRQAQQQQKAAKERERRLVELLALYQEQMELAGQWIAELSRVSDASLSAWEQQYAMLNEKIKTESSFCAIEYIGAAGEPVDYRMHEVLEAVEPDTEKQEGTVAKVCSRGMLYQGTVIRKARVTAYRKA